MERINTANELGKPEYTVVVDTTTDLQQENLQLKAALEEERRKLHELLTEKNSLNAEIEELTKTLFEEANGMVASEAQARWHVEQAQKRLEIELSKTLEMLALESEQTKFLRELVEQEKTEQRQKDPFLWDIDVFGARLSQDYYDNFYPQLNFNSRERSASKQWDFLSRSTVDSWQFKQFSEFVDECVKVGQKGKDDESLLGLLAHSFMRTLLAADIEPCLTFPVLERAGKTKSLLKKIIPSMLKNTCLIEPLTPISTIGSDSPRASPVGSIKSLISVSNSPSRAGSPVKNEVKLESSVLEETVAIDIPLKKNSLTTPTTAATTKSPSNTFLSRFDSYLTSLVGSNPESGPAYDSFLFSPSPTSGSSNNSQFSPVEAYLHKCAFCDQSDPLHSPTFRFRINTSSTSISESPTKQAAHWTLLCRSCRDRLVSVASFFTILRHLLRGLQSHRPKIDIYFDVLQAKRFMFYARSGTDMHFFALSDFEAFSSRIRD